MVQGGSSLGRSILTPKPTTRPTAKRTGKWQPPRRKAGPEHKRSDSAMNPSEAQRDRVLVQPSGSLAGTMPDRSTTTQPLPSGKGKGPTASLDHAPPPNHQVRATSQRIGPFDPRSRTSEVGPASKPARATADHYQAEVDRIEKERDEDDSTFVESQSQTTESSNVVDSLSQLGISQELSQDTLRINRQYATTVTPSDSSRPLPVQSERRLGGQLFLDAQPAQPIQQNRSAHQAAAGSPPIQQRRVVQQNVEKAQPTQQKQPAHQVAAEVLAQPFQHNQPARRHTTTAQPIQQQKRPLPQTKPSVETPPKKRQCEAYRHRNRRYENLKPASQAKRKQAIETLKSVWRITDAALMALPHAPRRTTDPEQPVMVPLDWNTPLLEGLVLLARATNGDFARACEVASEAFERESLFSGATQLNAEIVASALEGMRGDDGSTPSQRAIPGGTQRVAAVPPPSAAVPVPAPTAAITAGPSASGQRAPPSPSASPAMSPAISPKVAVKTEFGSFGPRRSTSALDEESSGAEDIDILEAKARLRKKEYELACERVAVSKLQRQKRQRDLEKLRGLGSSIEDAVCL